MLSRLLDSIKRVGLHYIDFPETATVGKRLPLLAALQITEIRHTVTNFG